MKRLLYLSVLLFIEINSISCTPETILEEVKEQACCGEDGELPPPPPPPPGDE